MELEPKELLKSTTLAEYEERRRHVWWQVIRLNSTLFILEKMAAFDLNFYTDLAGRHFWTLTFLAHVEQIALLADKLTLDGDGVASLPGFRNFALQSIRPAHHAVVIREYKSKHAFDATAKLRKRVGSIRDKVVGHLDDDVAKALAGGDEDVARQMTLTMPDMRRLVEGINELFRFLCFGVDAMLLPVDYAHAPSGEPTDIEHLLDLIAVDSAVFKMPETNSAYWPHHKPQLTPEQLADLTARRKKHGLPTP